jgi:hypothetical protein
MSVRTNYCPYPSFELGTTLATGWSQTKTSAATITFSLAAGYVGTYAQRWTLTGAAESGKTAGIISAALPGFSAGEAVTFSVWAKGAAVTGVAPRLDVYAYNAAHSYLGVASAYVTFTGTWAHYSVTYASLPANTAEIKLSVLITGIDTGESVDVTVDAALAEKSASLGDYFDGSTVRAGYIYAWTGTANASTSTETYAPAVSGVCAATSGTALVVTVQRAIAGVCAAVSGAALTVTVERAISGVCAAVSGASLIVTAHRAVSGVCAAVSGCSLVVTKATRATVGLLSMGRTRGLSSAGRSRGLASTRTRGLEAKR